MGCPRFCIKYPYLGKSLSFLLGLISKEEAFQFTEAQHSAALPSGSNPEIDENMRMLRPDAVSDGGLTLSGYLQRPVAC